MDFADDSSRPLTPKGEGQLRKSAAAMQKMDLRFDLILSSPFLRAKQTAKIVAGEIEIEKAAEIFRRARTRTATPRF